MRWLIGIILAGLMSISCIAPSALAKSKDWIDCDQDTKNDLSIAACTRIISAGKDSKTNLAIAYINRGNAYSRKAEELRAIDDYTSAIRLNDRSFIGYFGRAHSHMTMGDFDKAIADYNAAIRLKPGDISLHSQRAVTYMLMGTPAKGLPDADKVVAMKTASRHALEIRGLVLAELGEHKRALADLEKAIGLGSTGILIYYGRGRAHELGGAYERALADYRRALAPKEEKDDDTIVKWARAQTHKGVERIGLLSTPPAPAATPPTVQGSPATTAVAGAISAPVQAAPLGKRIALVVANAGYTHAARLNNPARDANAIAARLRQRGFATVEEFHDLDLQGLTARLKAFGDQAHDADWAVVYFAGHGIQVGGTTYLLPTDARLARASHVVDEAVPVDRVVDKVSPARQLRLVILDSCRENPFLPRMAQDGGAGRQVGRGLARIEPARGVLVAYAARDGEIAQDGEPGAHSPFAAALLDNLDVPGLEINLLFRRVRDAVQRRTGGQEPYTYGSLPAEPFYFYPPQ